MLHPTTYQPERRLLMRTRFPAVFLLLALTLAATACSHTSVRHLARNPFQLDQPRQLSLKFWRFDYNAKALQDSFKVDGRAYLLRKDIPAWAVRADELWLEAYVADSQGRVLARDLKLFDPAALKRLKQNNGIPFDFDLKPEKLVGGPLFIAFGYRMTLSGQAPGKDGTPHEKIFFGNESAVTRF
jgi:hypothetical protein